MFTPLPGRLSLGVSPEQVVAVIESINAPNIAIPEVGAEPTKAYLVGCVTPAGYYAIFCYLLQLETNRPIVYLSSPAEVPFEQYGMLEAAAIQYVESMGFMLDNLNFRAQPVEVQAQMIEALPFFRDQQLRRPRTAVGIAGAGESDEVHLARFLSSF